MRYILLVHGTTTDWPRVEPRSVPIAEGELVAAWVLRPPLTDPGRARLAACWIVDCENGERALEIAAALSAAIGRARVEVRRAMRGPGEEM